MDVAESRNGVPIRLTEERWIHINPPELLPNPLYNLHRDLTSLEWLFYQLLVHYKDGEVSLLYSLP